MHCIGVRQFIFNRIGFILEEVSGIMEENFLVLGSVMVGRVRGHARLCENRHGSPRDSAYVVWLV